MEQTTSSTPVTTPHNNKKGLIAIAGGGILILILGAIALWPMEKSQAPTTILPGDINALMIEDQNSDSVAVLVKEVSLITPGFVVIWDNLNGKPGSVIGVSSPLKPGKYTNTSVIAPLKPGARYYGTLFSEYAGSFNKNSTMLRTPDDKEIIVPFSVRMSDPGQESKG